MARHPTRGVYLGVFGALMALLGLTLAAPHFDLGVLNVPVMLAIATTKAVLIVLYFMHVRYSSRLTWIVVIVGFLWLLHMMTWTMADYLSRNWMPDPAGWLN